MKKTYRTNLRCAACEAAIKPAFDAEPGIDRWSINLDSPDKPITVEGSVVNEQRISKLLEQSGYLLLGEINERAAEPRSEPPESYFPLVLLVMYLLATIGVIEWGFGGFSLERAMTNFMAGFFLTFSFFKMLNLQAFADSYAMYDLIAMRSRGYAMAYPFIELTLGLAYAARIEPLLINIITLILMLIGAAGVLRSLMEKKRIRCACLGTVFNLPMSSVTLIEDVSMAIMAGLMLLPGMHS